MYIIYCPNVLGCWIELPEYAAHGQVSITYPRLPLSTDLTGLGVTMLDHNYEEVNGGVVSSSTNHVSTIDRDIFTGKIFHL